MTIHNILYSFRDDSPVQFSSVSSMTTYQNLFFFFLNLNWIEICIAKVPLQCASRQRALEYNRCVFCNTTWHKWNWRDTIFLWIYIRVYDDYVHYTYDIPCVLTWIYPFTICYVRMRDRWSFPYNFFEYILQAYNIIINTNTLDESFCFDFEIIVLLSRANILWTSKAYHFWEIKICMYCIYSYTLTDAQ